MGFRVEWITINFTKLHHIWIRRQLIIDLLQLLDISSVLIGHIHFSSWESDMTCNVGTLGNKMFSFNHIMWEWIKIIESIEPFLSCDVEQGNAMC